MGLDEILRLDVIWQRRAVVRFGLTVMGGPEFPVLGGKTQALEIGECYRYRGESLPGTSAV